MPRSALTKALVGVVVVLLIAGGIVLFSATGGYQVRALIPSGNPLIIKGAPTLVNGFEEGTVENIEPRGDKALLTLNVDEQTAPLHSGAIVFVQWDSTVGQRLIQVNDGPMTNPEIPNGGMIEGNMPTPMELSDILASLDAPTRDKLAPLAQNLQTALKGHEQDLNATLRTAGPAFVALGNVFRGVALDDPAINKLVTDTNGLVGRIGARNQDLSGVVNDLSVNAGRTAAVRDQLRSVLRKLPPTLDTAQATLNEVPGVTAAAIPLLNDAKSATDKLPAVANNLAPLLVDLRPTIAELKPTLQAASVLLNTTPGLLDNANVTVPGLTRTTFGYTPTIGTLRANTPAAIAFLSGWGSASRNGDANGNYVRILARFGLDSLDENPTGLGSNANPLGGSGTGGSGMGSTAPSATTVNPSGATVPSGNGTGAGPAEGVGSVSDIGSGLTQGLNGGGLN